MDALSPLQLFKEVFSQLFILLNPLIVLPVFVAITQGSSKAVQTKVAIKSCSFSIIFLVTVALFGSKLLESLGITMQTLSIGGGFLLGLAGFNMIYPKASQGGAKTNPEERAIFPLGFPMIVGPGVISVVINKMMPYGQSIPHMMATILASFIIIAFIYGGFLCSEPLVKRLGHNTLNILEKIIGLILLCFGVQMMTTKTCDLFQASIEKAIENTSKKGH